LGEGIELVGVMRCLAGGSSGSQIPGFGIGFLEDGNFEVVGGDSEIEYELPANGGDIVRIFGDFDTPEESLVTPFETGHREVVERFGSFRVHSHDRVSRAR